MASVAVYRPASLALPDGAPVTRRFVDRRSHLPGRPRLEAADYAGFERHAIFHDVFLAGGALHAIGPPLGNLARVLRPIRCRLRHANGAASPPLPHRVAAGDRVAFHRFALPRELVEADALDLVIELATGQRAEIEARRQRLAPVFLQLVTMQKDSPFEWIVDWLRYAWWLGVERVILYDNGSADFPTLPERVAALEDVPEVVLVDWPYAYGPVRSFYNQFSQPSQNNHAHRCFGAAEWTGHLDLDEYLVAGDGLDLSERLRRTPARIGALRVDSWWLPRLADPDGGAGDVADRVPTVRDFRFRERAARGSAYKYLVRGRALREAKVHNARLRLGWFRRYPPPETELAFLHYKALTTGWKTYWDRQQPEPLDPAAHVEERRVLGAMAALDGAPGAARGERPSAEAGRVGG